MNKLIIAAFVATALSIGATRVQAYDPSLDIGSISVSSFDSATSTVNLPASNFISFAQQNLHNTNPEKLDGQFKMLEVKAPAGLKVIMADADDDGQLCDLTRTEDGDLALSLDFEVIADGIAPGAYPVEVTLQNIETTAKRTFYIQVVVK